VIALGESFAGWAVGTVLLGAGTAMVNPTLLAVVGGRGAPRVAGEAVGVYRVWRDLGYAVGAVFGGLVADALGRQTAVWAAAVVSALPAVGVAVRMYETHPPRRAPPAADAPGPWSGNRSSAMLEVCRAPRVGRRGAPHPHPCRRRSSRTSPG
jgi:MFS family permease